MKCAPDECVAGVISAVDGIPVAHHQGPRSVTDRAITTLLALPKAFVPDRILSLRAYPAAPNVEATRAATARLAITFLPQPSGPAAAERAFVAPQTMTLSRVQCAALIARIATIANPSVPVGPSATAGDAYSLARTSRTLGLEPAFG